MATCPDGHDSASTDFCDVCGIKIGPPAAQAASTGAPATVPAVTPAAGSGTEGTGQPDRPDQPDQAAGPACPRCGTPRTGRFCESCGLDLDSPVPAGPLPGPVPDAAGTSSPASPDAAPGSGTAPSGSAWAAVVTSDRAYYDQVIADGGPDAAQTDFPAYCPERRFQLTGTEMRIGRRSASRGIEPEIDLTGPPTDPGISRLHAVLARQPDGTWTVFDPGSANGTLVNGTEVPAGERIPLHDGTQINLGAWTVITITGG